MFSNSAGFRFDGGNFYNVSGDVHLNFENHRHLAIQDDSLQVRPALEDSMSEVLYEGWAEGSSHDLAGIARNQRRTSSRARVPYDTASRSRPLAGNSSGSKGHNESGSHLNQQYHGPVAHQKYPMDLGNTSESTEFRQDHPASFRSGSSTGHSIPGLLESFTDNLPNHEPHLSDFHGAVPSSMVGGTFISAQSVHHDRRDPGMDILHRAAALDALYNSAESFPQPRCHPETRTEILDDLHAWATDEALDARSIFWLYGPAGAGKSAIMQTLSQRLQDAGRLGGSFFFKRGDRTRGNAKVLFVTLAYQLAIHNRRLKALILKTVEDDPTVVGRHIDDQFHKLISRPCQSLDNHPPHILLIDGLDECEPQNAQLEVLRVVGNAARGHTLRLKILIASRPESYIREEFEESTFHGLYDCHNVEQSFDDVRKYLHDEFSRIHCEHKTMRAVPRPWPSSQVMDGLVYRSSGYFIYAATVIRFIDDRDFRPTERLETVLFSTPESDSPFAPLDQLYTQILSTVPTRSRARLLDVLCCITHVQFLSLHEMEELLQLETGDFELTLRRLHSLVYLPSESNSNQQPGMHHASFRDFLEDPTRSGDFHIGRQQHMNLARWILEALSRPWTPRNSWILTPTYCFFSFTYIPSYIQPSDAESLVPLFQTIHPDFVLDSAQMISFIPGILAWLKKIQPVPETAVQLWADYQFLEFVTRCIQDRLRGSLVLKSSLSPGLLRKCRQLLADTPQIVSIFQMWWLADKTFVRQGWHTKLNASQIRLLLGIPWDDIRTVICSLRPSVGMDEEKLLVLFQLAAFLPMDMRGRWRDLAWGCLRAINLSNRSEIHSTGSWISTMCLGWILRSSPTCPTLLPLLRDISFNLPFEEHSSYLVVHEALELYPSELHSIVQWLKSFQQPPLDLIQLWNGYLETSRRLAAMRHGSGYSDSELEAPWIEWMEYWKRTQASWNEPLKIDSEDEDDRDDTSLEREGGGL